MRIIEMEKEILMYKGYIVASNTAIGLLDQARKEIDEGTSDLNPTTGYFTDGYKGGATSLAVTKIGSCNDVAVGRRESVTNTIAKLQGDISEFNQKIQQLEAERTAEIARLAEVARRVAAEAARVVAQAAEKAKDIAEEAKLAASQILN